MAVNPLIGKPFMWPDQTLDRGLVFEVRFNRNTGPIAPDWTGARRHVQPSSAAMSNGAWAATRYGPGWARTLDTDGDTNIHMLDDLGIVGTEAMTLEVFFRLDELHGGFQFLPVLGFTQTGAGQQSAGYDMRGDATASRRWLLVTNNTNRVVGGTKARPAAGDFVHAIMTYDGTNVVGYREGVLDGTVAATGTIDDNDFGAGAELEFCLDSGGNAHAATLLLARIYNRALFASEVPQRYQIVTARASGLADIWMLPFLPQDVVISRQPRYGFTNFQIPGIV